MYRVNELQDPTYLYKVDIENFEVRPLMEHELFGWLEDNSKYDKKWSYCVSQSICSYALLSVISSGHEDVFPDCSCPLHPLPDISGCQGSFRTQEHALLR